MYIIAALHQGESLWATRTMVDVRCGILRRFFRADSPASAALRHRKTSRSQVRGEHVPNASPSAFRLRGRRVPVWIKWRSELGDDDVRELQQKRWEDRSNEPRLPSLRPRRRQKTVPSAEHKMITI
jgi:hypothetical protein